jgi:hypothetical protein
MSKNDGLWNEEILDFEEFVKVIFWLQKNMCRTYEFFRKVTIAAILSNVGHCQYLSTGVIGVTTPIIINASDGVKFRHKPRILFILK